VTHFKSHTIIRRFSEKSIHRRMAKRKPLLTDKHRAAFRRQRTTSTLHLTTGRECCEQMKVKFLRSSKAAGKGFMSFESPAKNIYRNTLPTAKHSDRSVIAWGCFTAAAVGELHQIHCIVDGSAYLRIVWDVGRPGVTALL